MVCYLLKVSDLEWRYGDDNILGEMEGAKRL